MFTIFSIYGFKMFDDIIVDKSEPNCDFLDPFINFN